MVNLSNNIPYYNARYPIFMMSPRIAEYIKKTMDNLIMIDIGSSCGDIVSLISQKITDASFLCIEGEAGFLKLLKKNVKHIANNSNIYIVPKYCIDNKEKEFSAMHSNGTTTSILTASEKGTQNKKITNLDTLDNIVDQFPLFKNVNFLRIDTSGSEIIILRGAKRTLAVHPAIFIHFSPVLFFNNNQSPFELFDILCSNGYLEGLFYTNFGYPAALICFSDKPEIQCMIDKIDNKNIFYYSILTVHRDKIEKYASLIQNELNFNNQGL
jgi:FkbM family methyltransferase